MTTRSGTDFCDLHWPSRGRAHDLVDLQQDHRHVVVLRRAADEVPDLPQHALAKIPRLEIGVVLDHPAKPALAEAVVSLVHGFRDAVREEEKQVARLQWNGLLDQKTLEHLPVV